MSKRLMTFAESLAAAQPDGADANPGEPKQATEILQVLADMWRVRFLYRVRHALLRRTRSPIEQQLAVGILAHALKLGLPTSVDGNEIISGSFPQFIIRVQPEIAGLHPDLVVGLRAAYEHSTDEAWSAIECDGHDFHEKTKQQAARDKSRDRRLADEGFPVLRFTGSEIHADPLARGEWILSHLMRRIGMPF